MNNAANNDPVTGAFEALDSLILSRFEEDDMRSADHLWYFCRDCETGAPDSHLSVVHDEGCLVGEAVAALKKARGES